MKTLDMNSPEAWILCNLDTEEASKAFAALRAEEASVNRIRGLLAAVDPNAPKSSGSSAPGLGVGGAGQVLNTNSSWHATIPVGASLGYGYITANSVGSYTLSAEPLKVAAQSTSPNLPDILFDAVDEAGRKVRMTLKPENGITSGETVKLMMLTMAYVTEPTKFCPLAYVKAQNLERHFTYA